MIVCLRYTASVSLLLILLGVGSGQAWATPVSFSTSLIKNTFLESNGTTSSSVDDGHNSASSFLIVPTSTMGASVASDGSVFSVSTVTQHDDDWSCAGGCSVAGTPLGLSAAFDFDVVISAATPAEFSLTAQYLVLSIPFQVFVSADSSPITASANYGIDPVSVVMTTDSSGNTHVSTHFVAGMTLTSCNGASGPCGLFSDTQRIDLEMEGAGFVDASHTFSVTLTPTDPNVFLISADGRTAGTAVSTVPEPGTLFLLATGLVPATLRFRRRR